MPEKARLFFQINFVANKDFFCKTFLPIILPIWLFFLSSSLKRSKYKQQTDLFPPIITAQNRSLYAWGQDGNDRAHQKYVWEEKA